MVEKEVIQPDQQDAPEKTIVLGFKFLSAIRKLTDKILKSEEEPDTVAHDIALESLRPITPEPIKFDEKINPLTLRDAFRNKTKQCSQCSQKPPSSRLTSKRRM